MATRQDISRRCRARQLLSVLLLLGCSWCYVSTTVLLLHYALPCDAGEEVGEPQPAQPNAINEPEEGLPTPAPPSKSEEEIVPEPAPPLVGHSDMIDGRETTGGGEVETDSAPSVHVDLPDEILRCGVPTRTLPRNKTVRAIAGIYSQEYCQKLCLQEIQCAYIEWDLHVGLCYLKAPYEPSSSTSTLSLHSASSSFLENQGHAASLCPSYLPASQNEESCGARRRKQDAADSSSDAAADQEGSLASVLSERQSSSSFSPVFAGTGNRKGFLPFPSVASLSVERYTPAAATSLSELSSSFPVSPPLSTEAAGAALSPFSQQSSPATTAALRTAQQVPLAQYILEELAEPHGHNVVAPRTCGVSCWVSNYICSEMLSPVGAAEGAVPQKKANPASNVSKISLTPSSKSNKKAEVATSKTRFSPAERGIVYTAFDCRGLCEKEEACGAFSWNRFLNQCFFCPAKTFPVRRWPNKKAFFSTVRNHLTADRAYITGPKQSCVVSGPQEWVTPVFQQCFHGNKDTQSPSVTVVEVVSQIPTVSDCQALCFAKPTCHHFTWEFYTRDCALKAGPIHNSLVPVRSSISGPKSCFKGCLKNGVRYPEAAIIATVKTASVFDCQVACAAHTYPRCEGVTYYFATHNCDLAATPSLPSSSSASPSSLLSLMSSSLAPSEEGNVFQHEAAASQRVPASSTPSFISKEVPKPAGPLRPDAICTMCVSASAALCRVALPEVVVAQVRAGSLGKSLTRKRGRQAKKNKAEGGKRADAVREQAEEPRQPTYERREPSTTADAFVRIGAVSHT